jgi:hypothetical protein
MRLASASVLTAVALGVVAPAAMASPAGVSLSPSRAYAGQRVTVTTNACGNDRSATASSAALGNVGLRADRRQGELSGTGVVRNVRAGSYQVTVNCGSDGHGHTRRASATLQVLAHRR